MYTLFHIHSWIEVILLSFKFITYIKSLVTQLKPVNMFWCFKWRHLWFKSSHLQLSNHQKIWLLTLLFLYINRHKLCKAKIHFWSLYFGPILFLVPKLILRIVQSLKLENQFYFGSCCQPTNRTKKKKIRCGKRSALLANMSLTCVLKYD